MRAWLQAFLDPDAELVQLAAIAGFLAQDVADFACWLAQLPAADLVVPESFDIGARDYLDRAQFALMKSSARLIHVSRTG